MSGGKSIDVLRITPNSVSIDSSALNAVLDQVGNRSFAFYSINGPKRTGKSFMLNKFLHYLQAQEKNELSRWFENSNTDAKYFHWRGGSERNTIGINIWSKPFFTQHEGKEVAILLMDTQGSFDDQTTLQQNAIVFAVSALLSSVLIFNVMKDVGEDTLQFLQYFAGFARMAASGDDDQSADDGFQKLVFLIRDMEFSDFKFGYYDENTTPPGQSTNFKHKLNPNVSQPFEVKFLREQIQAIFKDVGVYALPHPGKDLARHDKQNNLDEEFEEFTKDFVQRMFSSQNLKLKAVGGIQVTGTDFKKYIIGWAKLFQSNDLPEVKSVFETAAEMQSTIAMKNGLMFYESEMKKFVSLNPQGVTPEIFMLTHIGITEKSFVVFRKMKKLGGEEYESRFAEELKESIEPLRQIYETMNSTNARAEKEKIQFQETEKQLLNKIKDTNKKMVNLEELSAQDKKKYLEELETQNRKREEINRQIQEAENRHRMEINELKTSANQKKREGLFGKIGDVLDVLF